IEDAERRSDERDQDEDQDPQEDVRPLEGRRLVGDVELDRVHRPAEPTLRTGTVARMKAPIRLGLQIPNFNFPGVSPDELFDRLTEIAVAAESSGFDSLFVMDHLHQ